MHLGFGFMLYMEQDNKGRTGGSRQCGFRIVDCRLKLQDVFIEELAGLQISNLHSAIYNLSLTPTKLVVKFTGMNNQGGEVNGI